MLGFAVKLTETPAATNDAEIDALREAGFSDRDILDIVEVVAYYAYANRIADGLGLETEDWIPLCRTGSQLCEKLVLEAVRGCRTDRIADGRHHPGTGTEPRSGLRRCRWPDAQNPWVPHPHCGAETRIGSQLCEKLVLEVVQNW